MSYNLPVSRRQSMGYPGSFPYDDQYGHLYDEPVIPGLEPGYQAYPPRSTPLGRRLTGPSYDDLSIRDSYYPTDRPMSTMPYPSVVPHGSLSIPHRQRRHSNVSMTHLPPPVDMHRRHSTIGIKFKRKGSLLPGVNLREAQSHAKLSNNDLYTVHDLHANYRGRILLKIRWAGYSSLTYEIPVEDYDGRVMLSTLARRISRACVHYLQANIIPVAWDRVNLHHIDEISYGVWQPMLSAY